MNRIVGGAILGVVLAGSFAASSSVAALLARDGLSGLDAVFVLMVMITAPGALLNLAWLVLMPRLGEHRSRIHCLLRLPDPVPALGIIVPVFKEDMERVAGRLAASWQSLVAAEPALAARTLFCVLSDSPADCEVFERAALTTTCGSAGMPLHYRRRTENKYAKPGNVHEFLSSPVGQCFDIIVGFDADSMMTGGAISRLVRVLGHPDNQDVAIVQSYTLIRRPGTLLSAIDGWSKTHTGMVPGVVMSRLLGGGNYFGHNYAARPDLLQRASDRVLAQPIRSLFAGLNGYIRSHDLAEGVALSEMGCRIVLDDQVTGSYEETPNTFAEYVARETRWLRGSLQHLVGGWVRRGRLPQWFVLVQCVYQHLSCAAAMVGLLTSLLILSRGDAFMGTTAPNWHAEQRAAVWAYVPTPLVLLAFAAACFMLPPAVSYAWNARRRARRANGALRAWLMLEQLPELVFAQLYGLFVGPLMATVIAMASLRVLLRRGAWQAHRDGAYVLTSAVRDLIPVWLLGAAILSFAAGQPSELRPFLLVVGVPLFISPVTAMLISSRRVLKLIQNLGLFSAEDRDFADTRPVRAPVPALPRSMALVDIVPRGTDYQRQARSSDVTTNAGE